ncbi:hypothetical protein [Aeromicrobium sp. 179-A 4D2 NHS]|uniref:hypothetical protein n=1 Tax=Aeromicrobium sp. 179-A 4D2 NHS TaxID=3142375 RepID=UPI0039A1D93F
MSDVHSYVLGSVEFAAITDHYSGKKAKRTNIPYMQHIIEGLYALDALDASVDARLAFCLHPLAERDEDLPRFNPLYASNPTVVMNVMEYRNTVNRYLPAHAEDGTRRPHLSPLRDVNLMLIADKTQTRKDFELFQQVTNPANARLLDAYFKNWLRVLGVTEDRYRALTSEMMERALQDLAKVWPT